MNTFIHPLTKLRREGPFSANSSSSPNPPSDLSDSEPNVHSLPPPDTYSSEAPEQFTFPVASEITMGFTKSQLLKQKLDVDDKERHNLTNEQREEATRSKSSAPATFEDLMVRVSLIRDESCEGCTES